MRRPFPVRFLEEQMEGASSASLRPRVASERLRYASQSSALHVCRIASLLLRFARFQHADALVDMGQSNCERETLPLAALDGEFAAVLAHNSAHN